MALQLATCPVLEVPVAQHMFLSSNSSSSTRARAPRRGHVAALTCSCAHSSSGPAPAPSPSAPQQAASAAAAAAAATGVTAGEAAGTHPCTRRSAALGLAAAHLALSAQLGGAARASPSRTLDQVEAAIRRDFSDRQYYITGNLTPELFTEDCEFIDPTTNVRGTKFYSKAVATLFDPATSRADLISLKVEDPRHLLMRWRFDASLNGPGALKPKLKPYTGTTRYYLNDDLLIYKHEETWDISALDAFVSILFPGFGAPPAPPVT